MNPDSPWLRGGIVLGLVFFLQEAVLRGLRIDGVRPDLLLGLGMAVAVVAGPEPGAVVAFAGGILTDLFVNTPFGLTALVACVVAFLAGGIQRALSPNARWSTPVLTGLGSLTATVVWAVIGTVLGLTGLLQPALLRVGGVVAAVNVLGAVPFAVLARWAFSGAAERKPGGLVA